MAEAASRAPIGTGSQITAATRRRISSLLDKRRHAGTPAAPWGADKSLPNQAVTQRHGVGPLRAGQGFTRAIDFRHVG